MVFVKDTVPHGGGEMVDSLEALARDEVDASTARRMIWPYLDTADGCREAYDALCRWVWRVMIEHRVDDDLRAWHRLLLDVAARMARTAPDTETGCRRIEPRAAADGVRAFAELLRLSVEASETADLKNLMGRTHVPELLHLLAKEPDRALARETIRADLRLGHANLSRILTLLAINGLIERSTAGKSAAFQITWRGLEQAKRMARPRPMPSISKQNPAPEKVPMSNSGGGPKVNLAPNITIGSPLSGAASDTQNVLRKFEGKMDAASKMDAARRSSTPEPLLGVIVQTEVAR